MMWKRSFPFLFLIAAGSAFAPVPLRNQHLWSLAAEASTSVTDTNEQAENVLNDLAKKLRLQVFDVDTGVYGLESKDPFYGIENIRADIHFDPSLGLVLTEVAHSDLDHRGLVMVSQVEGNARHETPIHVGDVIVGVFSGTDFKESTTGLDFDDTFDVITRAKKHATASGSSTISLELNRVVKKAKVQVQVEDDDGQVTNIDALAGDNLRLLLLHNKVQLYDGKTHRMDQPNLTSDCGGEAICGTCLVAIQEGMDHLNSIGPQEQTILTDRPPSWRAACKTVVGADNQEGSKLRILLHPQHAKDKKLNP